MSDAELHYPWGALRPEPAGTLPVASHGHHGADTVRWLRMSLPFALNHINLWLLRDSLDGVEGWTVVDCCIHHADAQAQWEQVFAQELGGLPVLRVIVTHMHPDHVGLAHWLCERWSTPERPCRLWMSATDYALARIGAGGGNGFGGDRAALFFASHGLTDPRSLDLIRERAGYYPSMVPAVPAQFRRLIDGQVLRIGGHDWQCVVGYGHAPEHMALHCAELDLFISGDMMLPRISTNISVHEMEPEANPLPQFLHSLERMRSLPVATLTLPSHGLPFTGLHTRIAQLHAHHEARLQDVREACAQPCSAADLLPVLFHRALDLHQTTFAMGEAVAHLHALWHSGELRRTRDAQGVWRFQLAA
jgi:glyoxylase-like metal-dependent hydrolase (beta-lactamase superfamily II)